MSFREVTGLMRFHALFLLTLLALGGMMMRSSPELSSEVEVTGRAAASPLPSLEEEGKVAFQTATFALG